MASDRTKRESVPVPTPDAARSSRPFWRRVPKGVLIFAAYAAAWLGAFLIFQGIMFLFG